MKIIISNTPEHQDLIEEIISIGFKREKEYGNLLVFDINDKKLNRFYARDQVKSANFTLKFCTTDCVVIYTNVRAHLGLHKMGNTGLSDEMVQLLATMGYECDN